jgi:small-conductance mechanosensitive channel
MERKRDKVKETLNKEVPLPKKIAIDLLGVLLIIASVLFGWLPGPGGVPLLIAGLSLLATNHEWARRLLDKVKETGVRIMDIIFNDHPVIAFMIDATAVTLLVITALLIGQQRGGIFTSIAVLAGFVGVGLLLGNRKRINKLNRFVKRMTNRKP